MNLPEILKESKVYFMRNLVVRTEKWISVEKLVPVLFRVFRSPGTLNFA